MADTQTTIGIKVTDNGSTNKLIKNAEDLAVSLDKAGKAAGRIGGSKALAAALNPAVAGAGAGAAGGFSAAGYRGLQGATDSGSAARDFAKQSQGIDGLVRVYATFAANVFAVSAAFRALREAAGTENLVKGLDQIGAASGRNLGSLAKQIVATTDGAINLREALTTVSQASSAGLTNKQIGQLSEVAKKASQALGISLPDAISRLSRGISKIEPELLDEIGIFTKIGPAVDKYALSVGKSASALTDFERRQAFANAVLEEGTTKFSEVNLAANPYDKLAASISNLSTAGLTLINTVVGPIIKFLSESPTALFLVLAGIGNLLLRQAIPALRNFRENLLETAKVSATEADKIAKSLTKFKDTQAVLRFNKVTEPIVAEIEKNVAQIQSLASNTLKSGALLDAAKKSASTFDSEDVIKRSNTELQKRKTLLSSIDANASSANAAKAAALQTEINNLTKINSLAQSTLQLRKQEVAEIDKLDEPAKGNFLKDAFSETAARERLAKSAQNRAVTLGVLAQASEDQKLKGTSAAFKELRDNVKNGIPIFNELGEVTGRSSKGLTGIAAVSANVKGGLLLIGGAINTVLASLGPYIIAFQLLAVAYQLVSPFIFKASKELDAFNSALETSKSAAENAGRTLDSLKTRGGFATSSIEGVVALSNALTQLKDSSEATIKAVEKFKNSAGFFDKLKNGFLTLFGEGVGAKFAEGLASDIENSVKLVDLTGIGEQSRAKLAAALRINSEDLLDPKALKSAIQKLGLDNSKAVVDSLKEISTELERSAVRLQSFVSSVDTAKKSYDEFIQSTANTNPLFKVGGALQDLAQTMQGAVVGGIGEVDAAFAKLAKNPERFAFLGSEITTELVKISKEFNDQSTAISAYKTRLTELEATLSKTKRELKDFELTPTASPREFEDKQKAVKIAQAEVDVVRKGLDLLPQDKIIAARELFAKGLNVAFTKGSELIRVALGQAAQQASLTIAKANLEGLTGANLARESTKIAQQEINIQLKAIDVNIDLILVQERLNANISELNAITALSLADKNKAPAEEIARLTSAVEAAKFVKTTLGEQGRINLENVDFSKLGSELSQGIAKSTLGVVARTIAQQDASRTLLRGQAGAARIRGKIQEEVGIVEDKQKLLQQEQQILQVNQQQLSVLASIAGTNSAEVVTQQILLDNQALSLRQKNEDFEFDKRKARAGTNAIELEKVKQEREALTAKQAKESGAQQIANAQKLLQVNFQRLDQDFKQQEATRDLEYQRGLAFLEVNSARIDGLNQVTNLEQGIVNELKFKNELDKLNNELATQEVAIRNAQSLEAEKLAAKKQLILDLVQKGVIEEKSAQPALQAISEELKRSIELRDTALGLVTLQGEKQLGLLQINKDVADEQERFNSLLSSTASIGESLGTIFGELGSKLSGAIDAFAKLAVNSEQGKNALSALTAEYEKAFSDPAKQKEASQLGVQIAKQTAKNQKDEIAGQTKVLGAVKNLFKEKTAGYKVLATLEKISAAQSIALQLQVVATTISSYAAQIAAAVSAQAAKTGIETAGFAARLPLYIKEIYASWGAYGPYVAAAAAVFIASKLGGSGSSGPAFVQTSEQRQQFQGTAQRFDANGNLVQTNRGVFGDVDAKSESIANSLEIIRDNSVRGLSFDNKMLRALETLVDSIGTAARTLFGIRGIRAGSLSGTVEGSNSSGPLSSVPILGSILGGLFGKTVTKTIIDSGLQIRGSLLELAQGLAGTTSLFETVSTTVKKKRLFGSKTSTTVSTEFQDLAGVDARAAEGIREAFANGVDILLEIGKIAGRAEGVVNGALSQIRVDELASLRGLTGEEFTNELNAVIGNIFDQAAEVIFSDFLRFAKFGEGALETVVRVVDTNKKVLQSLSNIGLSVSEFTRTASTPFLDYTSGFGVVTKRYFDIATDFFTVTQELAEAAGGLDVFIERAQFFADNFLTVEERIAPTRAAVINELQRLGLSTNLTKEGFKNIIQGLDLTTQSGRDTFTALQTLQESFVEVINTTEDLQREINDKLIDSLQKTAETVEDTVSKFRDFAKTVKTFRDSLLISNSSVLTPADKYIEAKNQFDSTYALALAGDDRAISNLTNVAQSFLGISRDYFASSDAYTQDFNSVVALLDQAGSKATATADTAQLQLDGINTQIKLLETINANIATIAGVPMAASGGLRRGLTLVGELGPELVDFTTAGRVYTADQTAGMFSAPGGNSQQAVVSELRYLRQEVCALRKQQSTETGHLIQAAYDAQNQNAEQVTEGMRETAQTQARIAELQRSVTIS